jgi:hypothetical protein
VFSITLSIPSLLGGEPPAPTANPIAAISDVTGGQVRNITNMKGMMTLMEELAGIYASQHAVVINFEVVKNTTNVTSRSIVFNGQHTLVHIYPHRDAQTDKSEKVIWPIPETYFPSSSLTSFVSCIELFTHMSANSFRTTNNSSSRNTSRLLHRFNEQQIHIL